MRILITGAAGNLGLHLARHLLGGGHQLNLMVHRRPLPLDVATAGNVSVHQADLARPATLAASCREVDVLVHFAGVLFAPEPERFLSETNTRYVENLLAAAQAAGVGKFIIVSFPHVEGESFPWCRASGRLDGRPASVHAQTRLAAEQRLFAACEGMEMVPVALRPGMIYGRGVLMVEAARWLSRHRLLVVWRQPTWIHLLALPDFLACVKAAIEGEGVRGVYGLGDDRPLTLQQFLDAAAAHWGQAAPRRAPAQAFFAAAALTEAFAKIAHTRAPLTRDFIKIGMASYVADATRMKAELLPQLNYPTLEEGVGLL